jgi:hypothetical protein
MKEAVPPLDFGAIRRGRRLPAPPQEASGNLDAPEHIVPAGNLLDTPAQQGRGERRRVVEQYEAPEPVAADVDGRSRLRTGRTEPFSTRVRSDFKPRLIAAANRHHCTMSEALERALDALDRADGAS